MIWRAGNSPLSSRIALLSAAMFICLGFLTGADAYDRYQAERYADKWWNDRNPFFFNGSGYPDWSNCANFVSQSLIGGGLDLQAGPGYNQWSRHSIVRSGGPANPGLGEHLEGNHSVTWTTGSIEWQEVTHNISTPHPYPDEYYNVWDIWDPNAMAMKVHFSAFNTEEDYDEVWVYDGNWNPYDVYSGDQGSFWSVEVPGSVIKIEFYADCSNHYYGFDIDRYAAEVTPIPPPGLEEGDVIIFGRQNDEYVHTVIVVGGYGNLAYCNSHDDDNWYEPWHYWMDGTLNNFTQATFFEIPDGAGSQANLTGYTPSGWEAPLIVSGGPGTHTSESGFTVGDPLYIDWAIRNNGVADIPDVIEYSLYIDNINVHTWTYSGYSAGLWYNANDFYRYAEDFQYTINSEGNHTIKICSDDAYYWNESDESDNLFSNTWYWSGLGVGDPVDVTVKNHFPNGTSGGTVMVSGVIYDSPLEFVMYEGDDITISAISPQNYGRRSWFTHWSDGGDQTHVVSPLAPDAVYTAYFAYRVPREPKGRIWDGNGFVEDNTILSPTWRRGPQASDVADYCLLNEHLAEKDGQYLIQIVQDDGEPSYFDQVELLLVEHPEDVLVGLHPEGEIIAYTRMTAPTSCVDKDGNDCLELMKEVDSRYFQGRKDDWLVIEFEETESTDLVLEAVVAGLGKEPIALQVQGEKGWEDIASIYGRANWSTEVTDVSSVVASRTERTKLRLLWLADHELDYVGLGLPQSSDLSVQECPLASVIHPRMGEVTEDLLAADQRRMELISGDEVELAFSSLAPCDGYQRDFILVSTGHRMTGEGDVQLPQNVADHPIPTSFSLSQNYPNPFDSRTRIAYSLPQDCHVTLRIYNAQWQLVRNLVSAEKKAGYHEVSWDGRNDRGEDVASGLYFCQTKAKESVKAMSMVLLR